MTRRQIRYNIDDSKPDHAALYHWMLSLKSLRLYHTVWRDGMRLMRDLMAGNLTVLYELFPFTRGAFLGEITVVDDDLIAQINRLERLLYQQPQRPAAAPEMPALPPPVIKASGNAAANFLQAAKSFRQ